MTGQTLKSGTFFTNQVANAVAHGQWAGVILTPGASFFCNPMSFNGCS